MTVHIHTEGFLSEAAAQKNPFTYVWFQIAKGKVLLDAVSKDLDVELGKGEKFGLKATKAGMYLLDEDNMSVQFKIKPDDVQALLKNAKGYSGKINGVEVRAGDPAQPPGSLDAKQLKNLESNFRTAMIDYIRGNKTKDNKRTKDARKTLHAVSAVLNAQGVKLPTGYKHTAPLGLHTSAARTRRAVGTTKPSTSEKPRRLDSSQVATDAENTLRSLVADIKRETKGGPNPASKTNPATNKNITLLLKKANGAVNKLRKGGHDIPADLARFVTRYGLGVSGQLLNSRLRNLADGAPVTPQSNRAARHPGLDVKQGAVPKQDKASEAAKRITEKTSTNALKRLGVTINRSSKTGIIGTSFVDARDVPRIKSTFESAGWKAAIRNDGSNREDGSGPRFKVLYLTLTGAKRYITIDMSGNSKGSLKIRHSK